jgi:hypothetical protein
MFELRLLELIRLHNWEAPLPVNRYTTVFLENTPLAKTRYWVRYFFPNFDDKRCATHSIWYSVGWR